MSNTNTTELVTVTSADLDAVTGGTSGTSSDLTTQLSALKSSVDGIASSQTNSSSSSDNMMLPMMMMAMNRPQAAPTVVAAGGPPAVIAGGAPVINVNTRVRRGC